MLSPEFIDAVKDYRPSEEVRRELGRKIMVPLIGPTAVGKSTLMEAVCKRNSSFQRVVSFTTRERRPDEPEGTYDFRPHTEAGIKRIAEQMERGELVQVAVHPTTDRIYGSELSSYPGTYNLLDTLSGEVARLRALPFGHTVAIALTTQTDVWQQWFMQRVAQTGDRDEALARLDEADTSIGWALHDPDVMWMQNVPDNIGVTAMQFIGMARGDRTSAGEARLLGIRMQNFIPKLRELVQEEAA